MGSGANCGFTLLVWIFQLAELTGTANPVVEYAMQGSGLCDQLFFLVHCMVFAKTLGADVKMAPFFYHTEGNVTFREMRWHPALWTTVLNVSLVNEYWGPRGLTLIEGPIPWPVSKFEVKVMGTLSHWVQAANAVLKKSAQQNVTPHIVYPPALMVVGTDPAILALFVEITRSLQFTNRLKDLADRIITALTEKSGGFVGVHLRVETDFLHHPYLHNDAVHRKKCRHHAVFCLNQLYLPAIDLQVLTVADPCFGMGVSSFSHFVHERKRALNVGAKVTFVRPSVHQKDFFVFG